MPSSAVKDLEEVKVPEGSKTSYQMADSWKKFMSIEVNNNPES